MKTIYYTASTLTGQIATTDHSLDWLLQLGSIDDTSYPEFIQTIGAMAMGSSTYEWLLKHHIQLGTEAEQPWPYDQPTWVFSSRSLPVVPGANLHFVRGDVAPVHEIIRKQIGDKHLWVVGGGELAGQFHDAGLLDELVVQIAPVALASGMPLFPRNITEPPLRLLSVTSYGGTFVELHYALPHGTSHKPASSLL